MDSATREDNLGEKVEKDSSFRNMTPDLDGTLALFSKNKSIRSFLLVTKNHKYATNNNSSERTEVIKTKRALLTKEAVTKVQAAIVVAIVVVAVIAGVAYYYLMLPPPAPTPTAQGIFMMTITAHDDWGWGTGSVAATEAAAEKHGLTWAYKDIVPFAELEAVFVEACNTPEYDIIYWSGIEGAEIICRAAHDYPDKLIISTCLPSADLPYAPPNWTTLFFPTADVGYLIGYLGTLMSETKKLGVITGTELMCGNVYTNGFKQGAYAADPEVQVTYAESGVWGDPVKDKETALALADTGVDVIFNLWCTVGIAEACRERGMYQIGCWSMREYAPDVTIADGIEDHETGLDLVVRDRLAGKPTWKAYRFPLRVDINEELVPEQMKEATNAEFERIMDGEVVPLYVINRTPDTWPREAVPVGELIFMDFDGAAYLSEDLREWLIEKYGNWK